MNELQFASRIRQILNQRTTLDAGVAAKLERARVAAGAVAQPATQPGAAAPAKKAAKAPAAKKNVRPAWAELTAEQQQILSPLKNDWDALEVERRQKWLQIAKRYPKMKQLEQERVQRRMQLWANLSPEQRRQARENYKRLAKSPRPEKKSLREQ